MIKNYEYSEYSEFKQKIKDFKIEENIYYGEVFTPFKLVESILSIIPIEKFENPNLKWLDPGSGSGNFSIVLYFKLLENLKKRIPEIENRKNHIINNMIYMVEIQENNYNLLKEIFGQQANIALNNFLEYPYKEFDIVIGNPPFNFMGQIKVPTSKLNKKNDGQIVWPDFVVKSISLLKKDTGLLCFFIPSLWLKPDKKGMYNYLLQYKIEWLNCFSNSTTNKIFKGKAQTPCCYFLLTKKTSDNIVTIYDNTREKYIPYKITENIPIPIFGQEICKKILDLNLECIDIIKTNMPSKDSIITDIWTPGYYKNIKTCQLNKLNPELIINYSNKKQKYSDIPKLILAHKMYGFPYLDISGKYGISNRDNYVIIKDNIHDLIKIQKFLSTKTALYLFETTRYRMKYLEKYAFQIIPDITLLEDFPEDINDETIAEYFKFDEYDIKAINNLHSKKYNFFI